MTCIRQEADSIPGRKTLVLDSLRIQTETLSIIELCYRNIIKA